MRAYAADDREEKGKTPLQVVVQTCTATMEINMVVSQKTKNQYTSRHRYTTLGHILKECSIIPQEHLLNYAHKSIIS